jgi:hypothetical protein
LSRRGLSKKDQGNREGCKRVDLFHVHKMLSN